MRINLNDLSKIYQECFKEKKVASHGPCFPIEKIVRCLSSDISKKERKEMVNHIANCLICAKVAEDVLDMSSVVNQTVEKLCGGQERLLDKSEKGKNGFLDKVTRKTVLNVASGILIVITLVLSSIYLLDEPTIRGRLDNELQLISPVSSAVTKDKIGFTWQTREDATHYILEIFDRSLKLVWRSGPIVEAEIILVSDISGELIIEELYFWRVTAVREDKYDIMSKLGEFSVSE